MTRPTRLGKGPELPDAASIDAVYYGDDADWDTSPLTPELALDDLTDVNAPTPADGDVLTWDDYLQEWIAAPAADGVLALDELLDVNAPSPGDGDALTWDAGASEWVPVHAVTEDDVIALITPDVYACASLSVISSKGSIAAGTHTDLHAVGGTTVQINETSTTPGFNIEAAFTGVDGITDLYVHGYYSATHTVTVELYNYDTTSWDVAITMLTSQTVMGLYHTAIADGSAYFDGGGNAKVRFYHAAAGNITHRLYLDYLAISHAASGGSVAAADVTVADAGSHFTTDNVEAALTQLATESVAIVAVIDGGGSAITTGVKLDLRIPFACTLTGWTLLADVAGAIVIDVWRDTYANFPPDNADALPGGGKEPTIAATNARAEDTSITDWTSDDLVAGDCLRFNVDSCTTITRVTLTLHATRT